MEEDFSVTGVHSDIVYPGVDVLCHCWPHSLLGEAVLSSLYMWMNVAVEV